MSGDLKDRITTLSVTSAKFPTTQTPALLLGRVSPSCLPCSNRIYEGIGGNASNWDERSMRNHPTSCYKCRHGRSNGSRCGNRSHIGLPFLAGREKDSRRMLFQSDANLELNCNRGSSSSSNSSNNRDSNALSGIRNPHLLSSSSTGANHEHITNSGISRFRNDRNMQSSSSELAALSEQVQPQQPVQSAASKWRTRMAPPHHQLISKREEELVLLREIVMLQREQSNNMRILLQLRLEATMLRCQQILDLSHAVRDLEGLTLRVLIEKLRSNVEHLTLFRYLLDYLPDELVSNASHPSNSVFDSLLSCSFSEGHCVICMEELRFGKQLPCQV